jgi:GT2 family glycosyltransferase
LRAKVLTCVDPGALRGLLASHQHDGVPLGRHLADPRCLSGVSLVDAGRAEDDELLTALANRIYGIRNRIVHAKQSSAENEPEPLFPFSAEAAALLADIEVLRYVAASVLIESAVTIKD